MKENKMSEKIQLIESAVKLSKFFGVEVKDLLAWMVLMQNKKLKKWNEIASEVSEFYKLPIEKRAEKMGFTVSKD